MKSVGRLSADETWAGFISPDICSALPINHLAGLLSRAHARLLAAYAFASKIISRRPGIPASFIGWLRR